jgi:hypothetical protein
MLFVSQRFNGIVAGGPPCLPADRQDSHQDVCCGGQCEDPPAQAGAVSEPGQPAVHEVPACRDSETDPGKNEFQVIHIQQELDISRGGPVDLPDPDLPDPVTGAESGHSQKSHAGQDNGNDRKEPYRSGTLFFLQVAGTEPVVIKFIGEGESRGILFEDPPDVCQAARPFLLNRAGQGVFQGGPDTGKGIITGKFPGQ